MTTPAPAAASLDSNFRVTVSVDGQALGEFDAATGGDPTSAVTKTRVGTNPAMSTTLGNVRDSSDLTVTKKMIVATGWEMQRAMLAKVGSGQVVASKVPLDGANVPIAGMSPLVHTGGIVSGMTLVSYDNESATVGTFVLMVTGGQWQ